MTQYPLPCQTLRRSLLKGPQYFSRRCAPQQMFNVRSIAGLQPVVPAIHLLSERVIFFVYQHTY
ncbi:hypothetical protein D3C81_1173800 [compost metagenome]